MIKCQFDGCNKDAYYSIKFGYAPIIPEVSIKPAMMTITTCRLHGSMIGNDLVSESFMRHELIVA